MGQASAITRKAKQAYAGLRAHGLGWLAFRVRHLLADGIRPPAPLPQVLTADVLAADLTAPSAIAALAVGPAKLLINWVMLPPSPGSGGHTTIFRILRHLEANGYVNRIYFYDPYRADHAHYAAIVRDHFGFAGPVEPIDRGMVDAHAVIATSWPTAYPVFSARGLGRKFYFVQDFEPAFYPASSNSILAENTYKMRLHGITAGSWLADKLRQDYAMVAEHFDFGCDVDRYQIRQPASARDGVAFYARPGATRRAFELGLMALELLAQRRPDLSIHLYGSTIGKLPFRYIDHGLVTPDQLNVIYNRCFAGLTLSLTNVSLVPHEMLAAGCIPVVNDAVHNRMVINNPYVRYAPLSPHALAKALENVHAAPDREAVAQAAARSVSARSWDSAGRQVAGILRRSIMGDAAAQMEDRLPGRQLSMP